MDKMNRNEFIAAASEILTYPGSDFGDPPDGQVLTGRIETDNAGGGVLYLTLTDSGIPAGEPGYETTYRWEVKPVGLP